MTTVNKYQDFTISVALGQDTFTELLPTLACSMHSPSMTFYTWHWCQRNVCDIVHIQYENSSPVINKTQINESK